MPQIAKGGKWVFGWTTVRADQTVAIPPAAAEEYAFKSGDTVIVIPGSRTSGGFGLTTQAKLKTSRLAEGLTRRALGDSQITGDGRLFLPPAVTVTPGQRLLVVRGSGFALGFLMQGPVFQGALDYDAAGKEPLIDRFD